MTSPPPPVLLDRYTEECGCRITKHKAPRRWGPAAIVTSRDGSQCNGPHRLAQVPER